MTRKALIWTLANQAYGKGLRLAGRVSIPAGTFLFRCYARLCPEHFMLAIDRSIAKGIVRIMRAQMRNGGWCWTPAIVRKAEQHPSSLGLTALIRYREAMRRRRGSFAAAPSKVGNAFVWNPLGPMGGKVGIS